MPTLDELHSPERAAEIRAKMSAAKKGKTWESIFGAEKAEEMRATHRTEETRARKSAVLKGRTYDELFGVEVAAKRRQQHSEGLKGHLHTEETKVQMSQVKLGKKFTDDHKQKLREAKLGDKHWRWKGGVPKDYPEPWGQVRLQALARDNYSCVKCGLTANEWKQTHKRGLHVDHISGDKTDGRLVNLQTLCPPCHVHKTFNVVVN